MQLRACCAAILLVASPLNVHAQPAGGEPQLEIANPNATFPAQQRALPPAEVIERGDGLYQVNCMACHGADLRGGDQGGPNLLRSTVVLNDVEGEVIGQVIRNGMNRMPMITTLDEEGIRAVAGYIHSIVATAQGQGAPPRVEYDLDAVFLDCTEVWINDPDHNIREGMYALTRGLRATRPDLLVTGEDWWDGILGALAMCQHPRTLTLRTF